MWTSDTTTTCPKCGKLVELREMQYDMIADDNICGLCVQNREVVAKMCGDPLSLFSVEELIDEVASRAGIDIIETSLDHADLVIATDGQKPVFRQGRYTVLVIKK
ncbi:MAG TPA: hypothetical protein VGL27_09375 [Negativicutes bacterium]|jgi:hypothetical protein